MFQWWSAVGGNNQFSQCRRSEEATVQSLHNHYRKHKGATGKPCVILTGTYPVLRSSDVISPLRKYFTYLTYMPTHLLASHVLDLPTYLPTYGTPTQPSTYPRTQLYTSHLPSLGTRSTRILAGNTRPSRTRGCVLFGLCLWHHQYVYGSRLV